MFVRDQSRVPSDILAAGVRVVVGDVRDGPAVERAVSGMRAIIHLAAATSGDWQYHFETTVKGTETLSSAAKAAGVERFLHVSSMSVYDFSSLDSWDVLQESSPLERGIERRNDYARAKAVADELMRKTLDDRHLGVTILRPGIVYGPRGRLPLITTLKQIHPRVRVLIGSGTRLLPVVYVDNLVDAFEAILQVPTATKGRIYNVVDDEMPSEIRYLEEIQQLNRVPGRILGVNRRPFLAMADAVDLLRRIVGASPQGLGHGLRRVTARIGFSAASLKLDTGWSSRVGFDEGLRMTAATKSASK